MTPLFSYAAIIAIFMLFHLLFFIRFFAVIFDIFAIILIFFNAAYYFSLIIITPLLRFAFYFDIADRFFFLFDIISLSLISFLHFLHISIFLIIFDYFSLFSLILLLIIISLFLLLSMLLRFSFLISLLSSYLRWYATLIIFAIFYAFFLSRFRWYFLRCCLPLLPCHTLSFRYCRLFLITLLCCFFFFAMPLMLFRHYCYFITLFIIWLPPAFRYFHCRFAFHFSHMPILMPLLLLIYFTFFIDMLLPSFSLLRHYAWCHATPLDIDSHYAAAAAAAMPYFAAYAAWLFRWFATVSCFVYVISLSMFMPLAAAELTLPW